MRKWIWVAPVLLLAGCSKTNPGSAALAPDDPVVPDSAPAAVEKVIPRGTAFRVRLDESLDTRRNRVGDQFRASLAEPVVLDGRTIVPRGTEFLGHVTESQASGRLEGRAEIALTLDSFQLQGREYRIETGSIDRVSANHKKHNAEFIGGGAGIGALIGGIAGGGKGALIGAGAGAGAGTAGAVATGKKEVAVSAESLLSFPLRSSVKL